VPVSWRIADGVVILESEGEPTIGDWQAAVDAALAAPGFRAGMGLLHDARRMARVPTPQEARARVDFLAGRCRRRGVRRWAVVLDADAQYGMGRLAEAVAESAGIDFRVFRERVDAEVWLRTAE
jgi:hypothetical protein